MAVVKKKNSYWDNRQKFTDYFLGLSQVFYLKKNNKKKKRK